LLNAERVEDHAMTPTPPTPPSPRFRLPRIKLPAIAWPVAWTGVRRIGAVVATVALIAAFIGTFALLRGGGLRGQAAAGLAATPTATDTPTATPTPAPTATATPIPLHPNVVVTQNQDVRPACIDPTNAYTVVLANNGDVAANWHVDIPALVTLRPPSGPTGQPLLSPRSSSPFWAQVQPADGSVAPGQTASFTMSPDWAMPCGGTTYHASVKLSFPSGATEPDIPLTYAGTGPAAYAQIVLVAGNLNMTQPCPASGTAPQPFTFAIKNIGNAAAWPSGNGPSQNGPPDPWIKGPDWTVVPPNPQNPTAISPGQTWTYTITPVVGVHCAATYHYFEYVNTPQGTKDTFDFSLTFS
jgi:hypothetical protein